MRIFYTFLFFTLATVICAQTYQQLMEQGQAAGLSKEAIDQMALSQGYSLSEIKTINAEQENQAVLDDRARDFSSVGTDSLPAPGKKAESYEIFGLKFFAKNTSSVFNPSANQPTPLDYRLGPGDELFVDIYGASEKYYNATVSPEGKIILTNIGPIQVSGKTISQARQALFQRLSQVYTGLSGRNPNTYMEVTLGQPRTIQVHITGEVRSPGTYTLSGFTSAFNALFYAGGPTPNGSLRSVRIYRNNQLISELDVYGFLIEGQAMGNIRLQNNDVIVIPPYLNRVLIKGEVKRPAYYELRKGETFQDLLSFAGSFTHQAYTRRVSLVRKTEQALYVSEVFSDRFGDFLVKGGDEYQVDKMLYRYKNRVSISGAVFRPGNYAYEEGLTLHRLIQRAEGLRGDAIRQKIVIRRTENDLSRSIISVNYNSILDGEAEDIVLADGDEIEVQSYYDQREEMYVRVTGEVFNPGTFPYTAGITLGDLLYQAQGLKPSADDRVIELSRRSTSPENRDKREIITLTLQDTLFVLKPFDHLLIRRNANYFEEATVILSGEVMSPGTYALTSRGETISRLIHRAGGLNQWSYPEGATLVRKTEYYESENVLIDKIAELRAVQQNLDTVYSESDQLQYRKIQNEIALYENQLLLQDENLASAAKRNRLTEIQRRNPLLGNLEIKRSETIALDLNDILSNPGSKKDLILEDGDILIVPGRLQTVRLRGHVLYPTTVQHTGNHTARAYVNQAGGFAKRALRRNTYVIYSNGEVARTRKLLLFNFYPRVKPGSEVIVPVKPPKLPMRAGEIVGISTSVTALVAAVIATVNQLTPDKPAQ